MKKVIVLITLLIVLVVASSCSTFKDDNQIELLYTPHPDQSIEQFLEIGVLEGSGFVRSSFSELEHYADIIVIGEVVGTVGEYVNTARDPNDISKPSNDLFNVGQVYEVRVEEYLKGEGADTIFVSHRRGSMILDKDMANIRHVDIEKALNSGQGMAPLQIDSKYLMFLYLRPEIKEFSKDILLSGLEEPWRFIIDEKDMVMMESHMAEELASSFIRKPLSEVIYEIKIPFVHPTPASKPTTSIVDPYPGPDGSNLNEGDAKNQSGVTPYP